ncbi:MAG: DUF4440 domain-containing protein [Steroidobacterales bacterium]
MKITELFWLILAAILLALGATPASAVGADTAAVLKTQTQDLMNAVTDGKADVWQRYLAEDALYAAEDGSVKTKAELVKEITPLPKEIWGKLEVADFKAIVRDHVAVTNWVAKEDEGYFGQVIHARYRTTDTWVSTPQGWQLLASQVIALRDDPPSITLRAAKLDEYVGTYQLTPSVSYVIRREGDGLVGQRTGRERQVLKAELPDLFFVPGAPRLRKVFQRDGDGQITGFVERRESWDIAWRKSS